MWSRVVRTLGLAKPHYQQRAGPARPRLLLTVSCIEGLQVCLWPERRKGHEGIAYLFGQTDGTVTLAVSAFRPEARTTPGSFFVEPRAMARGVRAAADLSLQVVAQVHTHPHAAYHSDGDVEGARIRYAGYASIVLPNYGRHLPHLDGAAAFVFGAAGTWLELTPEEVIVIPERVPWTRRNGVASATTARFAMQGDA